MAKEVPVKYYNTSLSDQAEIKAKWWVTDDGELPRHVFGVVNRIWEYQKYRELADIKYARLYHNMELVSLRAGMFARTASSDNRSTNRVTLNVIKSCIDTAASKIAKNKPRPMFLTTNGNWGLQRRAQLLTKYIEGLFDHQNLYEKAQTAFVDACVWGTGALKIFVNEKNQVDFERVIASEIVVDETEGRYKEPRQLHQIKLVVRETLYDLYPKFKQKIDMVNSGLESQEALLATTDMIKVIESWHLPSGPNAADGRHSICIENQTLFDEAYTKDYFPFVFFRWTPKLLGFFGMGLAEELVGIQLEINKLLRNIQIAQHLMAVPQVWIEANSHIVTAHLNNEIGGVKKYVNTPPIFQTPTAMSPEIYNYVETLYRKAFEITGISQMSASSVKPAGVTAAVALRELSDIESERFMLTGQRWEGFFMELTRLAVDMTRDIYTEDKGLAVKTKDGKFMKLIKWKDVDLDEDMYTMRVFPTALLPSSPAGKLQKTQELLQAGFLDKDEALALLDFPDTEKVTSLKTASRENILRILDLMIDEGRYFTPEPYMNLQLALQLTQNAYDEARTMDVPEDNLDLLRRFMDEIRQMLTPPPPPPVTSPAPSGVGSAAGVPVGRPQRPPVSELLPFGQGPQASPSAVATGAAPVEAAQ